MFFINFKPMKHIKLIVIISLICLQSFGQDILFKEFSVTEKYESVGHALKDNNNLVFNFLKMPYQKINNNVYYQEADSAFYDVVKFNVDDLSIKSFPVKSKGDTVNYCWTNTCFLHPFDNRYYFCFANVDRTQITTPTNLPKIDFFIESFNTNLTNRIVTKFERMPTSSRNYFVTNKLIKKDSFIFAMSMDTNGNPKFCKLEFGTGKILDTVDCVDKFALNPISLGKSGFIKMNWLNDSTIILLSDLIHYININSMTLLDTTDITYPSLYDVPGVLKTNIFDAKDTSYIFCNPDGHIYKYFKINSKGVCKAIFEIPLNNYNPFNLRYPVLSWANFDFVYPNHIYTTALLGPPSSDTFAICHTNISGVTDWIKVFSSPGPNTFVSVYALEDSSVFGFVQVIQPSNSAKYDMYYIRLDKNGEVVAPLQNSIFMKSYSEIIIYPNPSNGEYFIGNINLNDIEKIEILSSNGQRIKQLDKSLKVNISDLPTDEYYITIKTLNKKITRKILKN
jgi:Secretion system C-terminal sorting domain